MAGPVITRVVKYIRKGESGCNVIVAETHTRQFTYAQWQTYGTVGRLETWSSITNAAKFKAGDTIVINGVCTDRNNLSVSLYATVASVSGTSVSATTTSMIMGGKDGEKGEQGATLRGPQAWSDCATGYAFKAGGKGEEWKDVVLYNGNYYSCIKSHTKTSSNYPGSSTDTNSDLWKLGDKIELVATKILLATYALVENLGVTAIDMKDSAGNILFQAKNGNVICKTGTFENIVFSGTMQGVSGSFKSLDCVNEAGTKVGGISFGSDGKMWFTGDLYNQGYDSANGRGYRFYSADIWCRGQFGSRERNVLEICGSYGYYYTKGASGRSNGVYVALTSKTSSANETYYEVNLYGSSGDYSGMPVDVLVFRITSSTTYRFELIMTESQRVLVVNANDDQNNVQIYSHGSKVTWNGGELAEVVKLPSFACPSQTTTVLGRGLFVGGFRDNSW